MRGTLSYLMVLLVSFIFNPTTSYGQHEGISCGTTEAMEELYRNRPGSREKAREFNRFTEVFNASQSSQKTLATSYVIPVVFHVFGTDFLGDQVTPALIEDALQKTNEDFNGLNNDWGQVSALFSGIKSTLDIEFKLAKIDPNGNATTGITFNPVKSGFGNGSGYNSVIQQYAWDNYKYMNVYIMLDLYDDGTTNRSGVAWYPDVWMSDNDLARVVYNGRYLGSNTDENFRRVLTHEFGHYLNLAHTFDNGCAAPGDNVSDTPATTSNANTCNYTVEMCSGAGPANGENFMDYSDCYRMFTQGQVNRMTAALNHSTRQPLWQPSNLTATGVSGSIGSHLLLSATSFLENQSNDGTTSEQVSITAADGASFAVTGTLTEGVHFTTSNIPVGMNVAVSVSNGTTASFSLSGAAGSHAAANSAENLSITFLDAAISGGAGSLFSPTLTFSIDFIDPYQVIYQDITDITVNAGSTWQHFTININDNAFGAWYDNGKLRFETYTKPMICQGSTRNLTRLNQGDPINASSNWVAGGAYPDEHDLRTNTYTSWDGQSGYLGFQVENSLGWNVHGWFRVSVSASGNEYTIFDYAYNEDPNGTINAGQTTGGGNPPVAAFSASTTTIEVGQTVTFTDQSSNSPTSWNWTFAGGSPANSSVQNPQVTYNTPGVYQVSLEASNAHGSDTHVESNYINVTTANPTYCESSGSRVTYEWIAGLEIGSFTNTSGAQEYSDFTGQTVGLERGQNHVLTLTPGFAGSAYNEYFRVWIDYNQDGDFEDAGELAFDPGSASNAAVNGAITPPASASLGNTRMRVSMKYNSAPNACGSIGDGEVEDYSVNITEGSTPPPASYCEVTNAAPSGQYIKQVQIGQIDNSTTYTTGGYSDFTAQNTTLTSGSPTTLTVTPHTTWSGTAAKAWIDWNQDGDFNDANEEVLSGSGTGGSYSASVNVPANAQNGATRLRVRTRYGGAVNPCGNEHFSEVEDYTVSVNIGSAGPIIDEGIYGHSAVYPNPFTSHLSIDLSSFTTDKVQVTLFDLTGAIQFQEVIQRSENRIQIGDQLKDGLYVLQLKTDQLSQVYQIVKTD